MKAIESPTRVAQQGVTGTFETCRAAFELLANISTASRIFASQFLLVPVCYEEFILWKQLPYSMAAIYISISTFTYSKAYPYRFLWIFLAVIAVLLHALLEYKITDFFLHASEFRPHLFQFLVVLFRWPLIVALNYFCSFAQLWRYSSGVISLLQSCVKKLISKPAPDVLDVSEERDEPKISRSQTVGQLRNRRA